jgi:tetratricopeptide (TPR) repeat protein
LRIRTAASSSLLAAVLLAAGAGCAYFNTFYNARESYEAALESSLRNPDNPVASEEQSLRDAIEGAGKVLAYHPGSRWADDAQLLIGESLLLLGRRSLTGSGTSHYQEAMRAFSSAVVMTGDDRVRDRALLGMGRAASALGRYMDAAASFQSVGRSDGEVYTAARLSMGDALVLDGRPAEALPVVDSLLATGLRDSLHGEALLVASRARLAMGEPGAAAALALEASGMFRRGRGRYSAMSAAAEAYIEAGLPAEAALVLEPLRAYYSTSRDLAAISLLSGRASESAGDVDAAVDAYGDAAELDISSEVGAEALWRLATLQERLGRMESALEALDGLSGRNQGFSWVRMAADRMSDLQLLESYLDSIPGAPGDERDLLRLLAAEKRLDLYGSADAGAAGELALLASSPDDRVAAMAMVLLAGLQGDPDSSRALLTRALALADSGDVAGRIEEELGLPPGPAAASRPSAVLDRAWSAWEAGDWLGAWETASGGLASRWSLDAAPGLLWMAYISAEAARMDDDMVQGYLEELVERYPGTPEGLAAAERLGGSGSGDGDGGDGG